MKWSELIKMIEKQGFYLYKHGGNHDKYRNDKGQQIIVPRHRSEEVKTGLYNAIKKQIGL